MAHLKTFPEKIFITFFVFAAAIIFAARTGHCDGLDSLIDLGHGQAEIARSYAKETRAYNDVKTGIQNGWIKIGRSAGEIKRDYGEPVVIIPDKKSGMDKWIYKPSKSSFFKGEKACLFFDKSGKLAEIKEEK